MKKFYAFFAAALMSVSLYAAAPTAAEIAAAYDITNNVVFVIEFIEDAEVCNDIRFVGTPNNWGKGDVEGASESWDNCEKFAPVEGHEGWFAAELAYSDGFQGKPLQEPTDRSWTWDYQCGDKDAWVHVDGLELELTDGYAGECNIAAKAPGAYIYQLKYWKNHKTPCAPVVKHNYTIKLYAPDACSDMKPAIVGDFNGWKEGVAMSEGLDDDFNTVYTYSFEDQEGHGFKIKDVADTDWSNEMQYYVPYDEDQDVAAYWTNFQNYELGSEETIVLDYSDNNLYRFAKCNGEEPIEEKEFDYTINVANAPVCGEAVLAIVGSYAACDWKVENAVAVENGAAALHAKNTDQFKFLDKSTGDWSNEVKGFDQTTFHKADIADGTEDGVIAIDLAEAQFAACAQGIENITLTENAQKVVVDGVLYIVRDNKMFNVQGTQVR